MGIESEPPGLGRFFVEFGGGGSAGPVGGTSAAVGLDVYYDGTGGIGAFHLGLGHVQPKQGAGNYEYRQGYRYRRATDGHCAD